MQRQTSTRLSKVIWQQVVLTPPGADHSQLPCTVVQTYLPGDAIVHSHLICNSLVPPHSQHEMAFLHGWCHILPICYIAQHHFSKNTASYRGGGSWAFTSRWFLVPTQPTRPNGILIESSIFFLQNTWLLAMDGPTEQWQSSTVKNRLLALFVRRGQKYTKFLKSTLNWCEVKYWKLWLWSQRCCIVNHVHPQSLVGGPRIFGLLQQLACVTDIFSL